MSEAIKVWLVGGSVRDLIVGVQPKDFDYMVEATFEELKQFVLSCGHIILHEKPEFLTLRVKTPDKSVVDFACCREEADYDGRRPGSVKTTSLQGDLGRRDFTVNAMALAVDPYTLEVIGEPIIDLHNGMSDLANRTLQFVGNPLHRLEEDGLRWLRAIRFWITKDLHPAGPTKHVIFNPPPDVLKGVSEDRITEELNKCLRFNTIKTLYTLSQVPMIWCKDRVWLKATLEEK